jgi:ATP-dependent Clp protease, protease subunit
MTEENEDQEKIVMFSDLLGGDTQTRITGIFGEISEDSCKNVLSDLLIIKEKDRKDRMLSEEKESVEIPPIEFIVSTEGGNVQDMFSVYDCMRTIKDQVDIETFGLGKVMSAGILLLAAGTKGKRKVGKYCRLMMHSVQGGQFGSIMELETDIKEVRWYQNQFIDALASETKLSKREVTNIFRRKTDTYFDAEKALEWGIVDEIV